MTLTQFFSLLSSINRLEAGKRLDSVTGQAMVHGSKPKDWKNFISELQKASQVDSPGSQRDDSERFMKAMQLKQVF